jgi:hypothetical protein
MDTKNKKNNLSDFQEEWCQIVDKGLQNYLLLTPDERIWYNIQILIFSAENGGLVSFYYNSGADYVEETIEDLLKLGLIDAAKFIEGFNKLFPYGKPSKNLEDRCKVIENWTEEQNNLSNSIENKFFEEINKIENALIKHIKHIL